MKTTTVVISLGKKNSSAIRDAARVLREGGLVAFPTETVYGLGVNLENQGAVNRLYQVKGRPREKALTLALSHHSDLKKHRIVLSPMAKRVSERFWPGPLTLLLKNEAGETVGIRIPGHPVAREIIREAAVPIGLPSANPSGEKPPRSAEEVIATLDGVIDLILDGGRTELGSPSTIVDLTGPTWNILREGAIPKEEIVSACRG